MNVARGLTAEVRKKYQRIKWTISSVVTTGDLTAVFTRQWDSKAGQDNNGLSFAS